jgi:simple sugar transport system permease protein
MFYEVESAWVLPLMVLGGAVGGMLWASIPAFLKTRFNTNEILVSLMLNYVALFLLSYLVHDPWRDPEGFNFPESRLFSDSAMLPIILEDTRLHLGIVFALVAVVLGWVFVRKSFVGFQMQVAGLADSAALYAGFRRRRMVWIGLLVGGGAAGIAGLSEVAGPIGQLLPSISPGYGYAAIIVAFVGRLHPVGILLASLLMSLLYLGGESAQMDLGLPSAITGVFQGVLLFYLLAADLFINFRLHLSNSSAGASKSKAAA